MNKDYTETEQEQAREILNKCLAMIVNNVKGYNRQYGVEVHAEHDRSAIPAEAYPVCPEDVAELLHEAIQIFEHFMHVTPVYTGDDLGNMSVAYIDDDKQSLADHINSRGYRDKDGNKATADNMEGPDGKPVEWLRPEINTPKLTLVH